MRQAQSSIPTTRTAETSDDWRPLYAGEDARLLASFSRGGRAVDPRVDVFIAFYAHQRHDAEAVNDENKISDFDVWSLGNILLYAVGKGEHTFQDVRAGRIALAPGSAPLTEQDASAFFVHRIMNLRKLFPWIPEDLNEILMHFSYGTGEFYESVDEILEHRPGGGATEP